MYKWLILTCLLWTVAAGETAYRLVDENGVVHYSDRPMPGATQVELAAGQGVTVRPSARQAPSQPPAPQAAPGPLYETFNVLQPAQQETLWNIGALLDVGLELSPGLEPDHHIGVYLDGQLIDLETRSMEFTLQDVFRGIHTLQAVVLDANGEDVLRSLAVTFMVQQTSIQNPNNPNVR